MLKSKIFINLMVLIVISFFMVSSAYALFDTEEDWLPEKEEWVPDVYFETSFFTKYIWRGWNLGDEPVMQTDASISKWGLTFDIWTNYTFNNDKSKDNGIYQEFTEVDYTIDYTFNVGEMSETLNMESPEFLDPLDISLGYVYYTFPNIDWDDKFFDSHEVYTIVSYDVLLEPTFSWYWDFDDGRGSYLNFALGHTFDLGDSGITLDLGWSTGIIIHQWTSKTGWADMVFSGGVNIPLFNYFTVTPSFAYSLILDEDTYEDDASNEYYGGITISFEY